MRKVLLTREAGDQLSRVAKQDPKSARIIFEPIKKLPEHFSSDPFLQGPHFKRLRRNRSGRYRIIYRVLDQEIHVLTVALRKSVYE